MLLTFEEWQSLSVESRKRIVTYCRAVNNLCETLRQPKFGTGTYMYWNEAHEELEKLIIGGNIPIDITRHGVRHGVDE